MLGTNESAKRIIDNGNEAAAMSAGRNAYMGQLPRSSRDDPWWLIGWDSAAEETQGKAALSGRIEKLLEQSADAFLGQPESCRSCDLYGRQSHRRPAFWVSRIRGV